MPEGPEIRRDADRIGDALAGRVADRVRFALGHLRGWPSTTGRRSAHRRLPFRGQGIFGGFSHHAQRADEEDPPLLRITGIAIFGAVEVKQKPLRKRWLKKSRSR